MRWVGRRFLAVLLMATVVSGATVSGVVAAGPDSVDGNGVTQGGTGVEIWVGSNPPNVDLGIPSGYAALKMSQFASFVAGKPASVVIPTKKGSGAKDTVTRAVLAPMTATCRNGYPCVVSITPWLPTKHESRTIYCVVAFIQTIAIWDINTSYQTTTYSAQVARQDSLYSQLHGGSNGPGVYDPYALSWINNQFSVTGYPFYYLPILPASFSDFIDYLHYDLQGLYPDRESNYVRVNLANGGYGGFSSGGGLRLHATGSAGYDDTAGTFTSYDPWSHRSSSGMCDTTYWSSSQLPGCFWTMPQSNYFQAMDTSGNGTGPVWF